MVVPTKYVPITTIKYPVFVRNDEIPTVPAENGFLYNRIHIKPVETLEGNHYSGFKAIPVSPSAKKSIIVKPNAKVPLNLISKTPFHNVITTKLVPLDLRGNPSKLTIGATIASMQLVIPYSKPFRRPLNYLEYKKDFNLDVHV